MNSANDINEDPTFAVLPAHLKQRIDHAFNIGVSQDPDDTRRQQSPPRKRQKVNASTSDVFEGGGFIVDDMPAPGGFVIEDEPNGSRASSTSLDDDNTQKTSDRIPLRLIPRALQLLDLQPDDEDVLEVFRNAASGWENASGAHRVEEEADSNLAVSLRDWRAVCAALLDVPSKDEEEEEDGDRAHEDSVDDEDESDLTEEEYVESGSDGESEHDSDDEYAEGGFVRQKHSAKSKPKGGPRARSGSISRMPRSQQRSSSVISLGDDEDEVPQRISARQKAECRRTFALFFPEASDTELHHKRIMIRDIARVADLLKEKISTEEIIHMLEAFSTSPDKSMSLADFERMMIAAQMA